MFVHDDLCRILQEDVIADMLTIELIQIALGHRGQRQIALLLADALDSFIGIEFLDRQVDERILVGISRRKDVEKERGSDGSDIDSQRSFERGGADQWREQILAQIGEDMQDRLGSFRQFFAAGCQGSASGRADKQGTA